MEPRTWHAGYDPGVHAEIDFAQSTLADHLRLHGNLLGTGTITLSPAPLTRLGYSAAIGVEYLPTEWLSFAATGTSLFLYQADLDHASIAGAARVRIWEGLAAELYVGVPFGGGERNLGHGGLNLSWRVD